MPQCSAPGCFNRSKKDSQIYMASFPRDPKRRASWTQNVGKKNWSPKANAVICEEHFTADMWERKRADGKKKLKNSAVPTIFLTAVSTIFPTAVSTILPTAVPTIFPTASTSNILATSDLKMSMDDSILSPPGIEYNEIASLQKQLHDANARIEQLHKELEDANVKLSAADKIIKDCDNSRRRLKRRNRLLSIEKKRAKASRDSNRLLKAVNKMLTADQLNRLRRKYLLLRSRKATNPRRFAIQTKFENIPHVKKLRA